MRLKCRLFMLVSDERAARVCFFFPASLIFIRSAVKEHLIDTGNCNKAYEKDYKHQCSVHNISSFSLAQVRLMIPVMKDDNIGG